MAHAPEGSRMANLPVFDDVPVYQLAAAGGANVAANSLRE
jgi:hypothetical protein